MLPSKKRLHSFLQAGREQNEFYLIPAWFGYIVPPGGIRFTSR
jgi:hypothetical protein